MTSEERHAARRKRREAQREAKRVQLYADADNYDKVFSYGHLYRAYRCCRRGVAWKASVQKYIAQAPTNVFKTYRQLCAGRFSSPGFFEFDIFERGKARHIRSTVISERVVQRCICDNSIVPLLGRTFVYDNGACMKNKGYDFAVNRMKRHLREYYQQYGSDGYILLYDFSKFFDNVSHDVVKQAITKNIKDERIIKLAFHLIDAFGDVGLGLGSQISQILALASANRLDHAVKEIMRIQFSNRYNDDGYLIHPSKAYLIKCLGLMRQICDELGIKLNAKKTMIVPLRRGFSWLKMRVFLTKTGKVITKIYKKSVTRMRRRLKKLRKKLLGGKITLTDFQNTYTSWRSYAAKRNCYHTLCSMDKHYNRLLKGCVTCSTSRYTERMAS